MFEIKFVEKIKTHILYTVTFFDKRAVYEKMCKNIVERVRSQMTIWRMPIPCWMPKATNIHKMCNTHCFCTAKIVVRTCLNVALYVHCMFCYNRDSECLLRGANSILYIIQVNLSL